MWKMKTAALSSIAQKDKCILCVQLTLAPEACIVAMEA